MFTQRRREKRGRGGQTSPKRGETGEVRESERERMGRSEDRKEEERARGRARASATDGRAGGFVGRGSKPASEQGARRLRAVGRTIDGRMDNMAIIVRHADKQIIEPARMVKKEGRQGRRERVSRAQSGGRDPRGREARAGPSWPREKRGKGSAGLGRGRGWPTGTRGACGPTAREGAGGRNGPHRAPEPARRPRHRLDPQADRVPRPAKGQLRRPASPRH